MSGKIFSFLYWMALFLVVCPVLNFLPAYNEIKFVGVPIIGMMGGLLFRPSWIKMDLFHLIFLVFCILSITQVKIISLVWQPLFSWISIVLLAMTYRTVEEHKWLNVTNFFKVSFLGMLLLIGVGILKGIRGNQGWVDYCGQNINYASVIPIVLSPAFIFGSYQWRWVQYFHPLIIGILWYFTYYFRSGLGIGLIGLITIIYLIRLLNQSPNKNLLRGLLGMALIIGLPAVGILLADKIPQFSSGNSVRWQNYQLSWMAFLDQPLIGKGLGNWYFFMQDYIPHLKEPYAHGSPMFSHSFVGRMLSEIGIIGFTAFFIPIFSGLYQSLKKKALLEPFPLMIILLLGTFFTFRPAESNEQTFNEIPLWLFLVVAHLQRGAEPLNLGRKLLSQLILVLLPLAAVWSCYWFYCNHQYLRSIQYRKQRAYDKEYEILTRLYHPVFRSIVGSDLFSLEDLARRAKARMPVVIEEPEVIVLDSPIEKEMKVISQKGVMLKPGFSVLKGKKFSATVVSPD